MVVETCCWRLRGITSAIEAPAWWCRGGGGGQTQSILTPWKWETSRTFYLCSNLLIFIVVKPFVSTVKKASKMEVEERNFCGRKIRMCVRIEVTAVTLGTMLGRKSLPPSSVVGNCDATPAISRPGSTRSLVLL
jgi:hypothetical protein